MIYSKGTMATAMLAASFWADPPHLAAADLKPAAIQAFERYVRAAEARMEEDRSPPGEFLYTSALCAFRCWPRLKPQPHDGYLWRLNSYWRFEQYEGGVIAEWESITLSRDIPLLLRWIVRPFVERLARNMLRDTLVATRNAVNADSFSTSHPRG